jgi:DNA-binding response OmpR family regulator
MTTTEKRPHLTVVPTGPRATSILLVEDNPGDARLLLEALTEASAAFQLTHVGRLADARYELSEQPFDLVLLDLSLPDSNGLETFTRLHVAAPHVPFVVLTGLADETVGMRAVRAGAQDFLIKGTMGSEALVRALAHAIVRHRARRPIEERVLAMKR